MNARSRSVLASLLVALVGACAEHLATLPPSDHYLMEDQGEPPHLEGYEKEFIDDVNKELVKQGQPAAVPGAYEMKIASTVATIALAKRWHGSSREVADQKATPGVDPGGRVLDGGQFAPLYPVSDEKDSNDPKTVHWRQQFIARGLAGDFSTYHIIADYPQRLPDSDQIEKAVHSLKPLFVEGKLRIGVARLDDTPDSKVIFIFILRDERLVLGQQPPRKANPGETFSLSGRIIDPSLASMTLGVEGPDGKATVKPVEAKEDGSFSTEVELSSLPGLNVVTLERANGGYLATALNVPVFAGVPFSPWPIYAPPGATPPDTAMALAKAAAKAANDWRVAHNMPPLNISTPLCVAARAEATRKAEITGKVRGAQEQTSADRQGMNTRSSETNAELRAAGFDPELVYLSWGSVFDTNAADVLARIPATAVLASYLSGPEADRIGIGVARIKKDDKDDSDVSYFSWVLAIARTPKTSGDSVKAPAGSETQPAAPVAPATAPAVPSSKTEKAPDAPASPSPEPANPPTPVASPPAPAAPAPSPPAPK